MKKKLVHVGYWRKYKDIEDTKENLPWPEEGNLSLEDKRKITDYLIKGKEYAAWRGYSICRICGQINGSTCLTDGEFVYPEGYAHYILHHNIVPDVRLLKKFGIIKISYE